MKRLNLTPSDCLHILCETLAGLGGQINEYETQEEAKSSYDAR